MRPFPANRGSTHAARLVAWAAGGVFAASLALACAGIIGIDDRLPDDALPGAEAGEDVTIAKAAAPTSCADAARCIDVPEGWQLASLDPEFRRGCAAGYAAPQDVVVATDGLGCTCKCTETSPGSCAAPGVVASFRDYPAAGCANYNATFPLAVLDGGCANAAITTTAYVRVPTAAATLPACAADPASSPLKAGQSCDSVGSTCKDGGRCAGALRDGERLCVAKLGDVACPPGFDRKLAAGARTAADTRKCGTCTCTPEDSCSAPYVELFAGAACTKAMFTMPATGSCTNVDAGTRFASYRYRGKAPGCEPSPSTLVDGGVTIEDARTFCCEPRD